MREVVGHKVTNDVELFFIRAAEVRPAGRMSRLKPALRLLSDRPVDDRQNAPYSLAVCAGMNE